MALIVAMGPPKKGNKMKKKEEFMLEDEDMSSDMDLDDESEYDDLDDMEELDGEDEEDELFGDSSDDADLEMLVEDVMSSFENRDVKGLLNGLRDFIRSVVDKG